MATHVERSGVFTRVWTVPNALSLLRLACAPLVLWLLFGTDAEWAAFVVLAVLGASDWVDGWIARRFHQGSELGKILDPTADRILLLTGVIALLVDGSVPAWFGVLVLAREFLIGAVTVVLALAGARRIDVLWAGKAGTFGTMFALPAFLGASLTDGGWHTFFLVLAYVCAIPALCFSYYSAARYLPEARRALRDGRAARHSEVVA